MRGLDSMAMENGAGIRNARARQRAVAIGIAPRAVDGADPLAELKELLRTAGVATAGELVQVRPEPDPDRYFGRGKLAELKAEVKRSGANLVASDDELAPRQERNLEAALDVPVIDRTAIILDIFAGPTSSALAPGAWTAGSEPGGRVSRRSRRTAGWRAIESRRCAAGSSAWSETEA
jgi:hypothetical protein